MMNLVNKLLAALRGGSRKILETAIDSQGLHILNQEVIDCGKSIQQAKHDLAQVVAEKFRLQRDLESFQNTVQEKEISAINALKNNDNEAALSLAKSIVDGEEQIKNLQERRSQIQHQATELEQNLKEALTELEHYRLELRMAQATNNIQQANKKLFLGTTTVAKGINGMTETLGVIKNRQSQLSDQINAAKHVDRALNIKGLDVLAKKCQVDSMMTRLTELAGSS